MKLYRKFIRPMHSYPGPDYSPRTMPIEKEVKWYPEEERECLEKKYASYNEGSFSNLVFEEKYELCLPEEQEAVEPKTEPSARGYWYSCGACGGWLFEVRDTARFDDRKRIRFCASCGKMVKWE